MRKERIIYVIKLVSFFALTILISCNMFNDKQGSKKNKKNKQNKQNKQTQQNKQGKQERTLFYVGSYTNGESEGIYAYALNTKGIMKPLGLAAEADNPSFLAMTGDKKYLLAVGETNTNNGEGSVESFRIAGKKLTLIDKKPSGGAHPCFVSINHDGYILTANYSSGSVGLLKLKKDGTLTDLLDVEQHEGSGTTDRQEGPHAHSDWFEPDGSGIISADLGTNELWFSTVDSNRQKLVPRNPQKLAMAPGAGPRHLTFHPNKKWIYVLNELNNTITQLEKSGDGNYKILTSVSTLPDDFDAFSKSAHIVISADGKFVYASNRGHNSIAIFEVNPDNGNLRLLALEPTHGDGPRHFALSPDEKFLVVANQNTNNLVSFKRDASTGLLSFVAETETPAPVCVIFE